MRRKVRAFWRPLSLRLVCSVCYAAVGEFGLEEIAALARSPVQCGRCGSPNVAPPDLLRLAEGVEASADPDNPPGRAEAFDAIVGNPLLRRALEICLAGYHTLTVVGREEDNWEQVCAVLGDRAARVERCPCGNYLRARAMKPCTCTLPEIEAHQASRAYREAQAADVIVETYTPKAEELWAVCEPYANVLQRIRFYRRMEQFGGLAQFEYERKEDHRWLVKNEAFRILDAARVRLGLGVTQLRSTQMVARTIATLDRAKIVGPVHMAEAVGYRVALLD